MKTKLKVAERIKRIYRKKKNDVNARRMVLLKVDECLRNRTQIFQLWWILAEILLETWSGSWIVKREYDSNYFYIQLNIIRGEEYLKHSLTKTASNLHRVFLQFIEERLQLVCRLEI